LFSSKFLDILTLAILSWSLILYFSILLHCIVQWVLQVMFPSACSFIVCWFSLSFSTCFGLHGHLHVFGANNNISCFTNPQGGKTCRVWPREIKGSEPKKQRSRIL
jgi:hypothetical protein